MSEELSLRIDLLDRQLLDADDRPFGRVDDARLELPTDGAPQLEAILTGAEALGQRLGGARGRVMSAVARRFRTPTPAGGPTEIDAAQIADVSHEIRLHVPLRELAGVAGLERWLAKHVIARIPGAGDARE